MLGIYLSHSPLLFGKKTLNEKKKSNITKIIVLMSPQKQTMCFNILVLYTCETYIEFGLVLKW
jgi:hypothetical protein